MSHLRNDGALAIGICLMFGATVASAGAMPKWSAERHDVDDGTVVRVDFAEPFDVGRTCDKPSYGTPGKERTENSHVEIVPCALYCRAKVLCTVSDDPKRDRAFVFRLTRYADGPGWNNGITIESMADTLVSFDQVRKRKVGDKWELEFPVNMDKIVDLLDGGGWGTFVNNYRKAGGYLDVDLLSRTQTRREVRSFENRHTPDPRFRSGITVHGFSLVRAPVSFKPVEVAPGNVFSEGESPSTKVKLTVLKPGDYALSWEIRNVDGVVVCEKSVPVKESGEVTVDLAQKEVGWYSLVFKLKDSAVQPSTSNLQPPTSTVQPSTSNLQPAFLTHTASFAILPKDTRTEGVGEGPYGTWSYGGTHRTSGKIDFDGPLLEKAGFRRAQGLRRYTPADRQRYKLSCEAVRWPGGNYTSDVQYVNEIRRSLADNPGCRSMLVWHENARWGYQMAPEMYGAKYDPAKHGWFRYGKPIDVTADAKEAKGLVDMAKRQTALVRKYFPEVKLTLGNSLGCTELVAQAIRGGLPESAVDYMGLEPVVRNNLPERPWESSLLAGDLMLDTAKSFGYKSWKVNACFESCYRLNSLIGDDLQAAYYVRDILMCQAWRFPDIFIGVLCDTGNDYTGTFWGGAGLCTRFPYAYPKKSYVAVATATRLLDRVVDAKFLPTGDASVYALVCTRTDGKVVTAFWSSRGEADLKVDVKWSSGAACFDLYGRKRPMSLLEKADGNVRYLVTDASAVRSVAVSARRYPEDAVPKDFSVVDSMDDVSKWRLVAEKSPILEREPGPFMPYRTRGDFALRQVKDEELGDAIELELVMANEKLPPMMWEYAVLELNEPIALKGDPASLGVRVKGNAGWGQVGWVLEDAAGHRGISLGRNAHADVFDYQGSVSVDFTGWNFLRQLIDRSRSSVFDTTTNGEYVWDGKDFGNGPYKLCGLAVAVQSRPLYVTERRETRQVLRFRDLGVFD